MLSRPRQHLGEHSMQSTVLIGNCQIRAMHNLYVRFVSAAREQRVTFIESYEDLSDSDRNAIQSADVIVEQVQDFKPKADVAGIETFATRIMVPLINCGFLWPFAGQQRLDNPVRPYLESGPYGGEAGDAWLNRMIRSGVDPQNAGDRYMKADNKATLKPDCLFENVIHKQPQRDGMTRV